MNQSGIREAIENLSAAIAADPSKAKAKPVPATARFTDGLKCEVTGPQGQRMLTDMPPAMGGAASAPNPGWYMRGAIASCTATVIAMRAAKLGIALEALEVTVESGSDHRGLLGLDEKISAGQSGLRMTVRIRSAAEPQTLRELVAWGEAHSPVGCTVKDSPPCSLDIELL
ncbi:MAG TPA: OsmC family protein [Burkholderiales bacterium]|nr:OsmC family protein [Burkholderiales bacterium]